MNMIFTHSHSALLFLMLMATVESGGASANSSVEGFLKTFHSNPAKMMQKLPDLVGADGSVISRGYISTEGRAWDIAQRFRAETRQRIMGSSIKIDTMSTNFLAEGIDDPEKIIEPGTIIRSIDEMQMRGLTGAAVPKTPWTDSYWPTHKGITGHRYADRNAPDSKDWLKNNNYILSNPALDLAKSGNSSLINEMAPAEKYDLVMGDTTFSLTRFGWAQGAMYQEKYGYVPNWVGICHGWAAAAHLDVPFIKAPVTVLSSSGIPVVFYPQDIKALQSLLWANSAPAARFAGNRCNSSNPPRNKNGRILDPRCFDIGPGTLHVALVNQLGVHKRSFVMDSTFDFQVWNFPIASYRYQYFNPQTWTTSSAPEPATILIEKFQIDKFSEFRDKRSKYILGIYLDVTYVREILPHQTPYEVPPPLKTIRYIYDLELDADRNIVRGEWYSNAHPDFIWTYSVSAEARAKEDGALSGDPWERTLPIPPHWAESARRASNRGTPLQTFLTKVTK